MSEKKVSSIVLSPGVAAWQAHCLHCGSAYLVAHQDPLDGARLRFCAVCGELAVYTRLDGHGRAALDSQEPPRNAPTPPAG